MVSTFDLADDELYARLTERGISSSDAHWMVAHREYMSVAEEIEKALDE